MTETRRRFAVWIFKKLLLRTDKLNLLVVGERGEGNAIDITRVRASSEVFTSHEVKQKTVHTVP